LEAAAGWRTLLAFLSASQQLRLTHLSKIEAVTKLVPSAEADSVHSLSASRHFRAGLSHAAASRLGST